MSKIQEFDLGVTTSTGTFTRAQLEAMNKGKKRELIRPQEASERYICPFSKAYHRECKQGDCALYIKGACAFGGGNPIESQGKACPITPEHFPCGDKCALFDGGCTISR